MTCCRSGSKGTVTVMQLASPLHKFNKIEPRKFLGSCSNV